MRKKRPRLASPDEVKITRNGDEAIIEYVDGSIATTHFRLGPKVQRMTDQQILDEWNDCLRAQEIARAEYEHVPVEIPVGAPQIKYFAEGDQWTPRGDVLRCVIHDDRPHRGPVIEIDDRELSWKAFGRLLTTYAGWGMRIVFVPDDELHEEPRIEIRDPDETRKLPIF